ncbi:MAG: Zn-dependent protease [Myxococcota bacterium]|jgi:Zn-dependent protease
MTLFSVRGIPIRLHSSFLILAAVFIGADLVRSGLSSAAITAVFGFALFGSVLLHELGHALTARHFGILTRSITLYPFGGVAALAREPMRSAEELWIALAGPAVNGALALIALPLALIGVPGAGLFAAMNLVLGVFNLIPAFPMDGGRVLRAWLSRRKGRYLATEQALNISKWFAWGFLALGIGTTSFNLLLIGGFLLFAINMERKRMAFFMAGKKRRFSVSAD